ncbi:MAG: nucleotidyl transferase AbiEii/AbiGii toxin family protein [Hymenobacter sp.]|nr:MAG: nucleotidyl transferase AbiEii/AbiGii toxin family protein [Hymenobacter sp.]
MLRRPQIKAQYPAALQPFSCFILRKYLQHKLLQLIYDSLLGDRFFFLGDTSLRIVHGNSFFLVALDFDNTGVTTAEFGELAAVVARGMELEGYKVSMKMVLEDAYHCHVRFPELLFKEGLSGYREERILIQLDTESQHFAFEPELSLFNRFDIFTQIQTTPPDPLLAQKFYIILHHSRNKGRDFCNTVFLLGRQATPNYAYLTQKRGIETPADLRNSWLTARLSIGKP